MLPHAAYNTNISDTRLRFKGKPTSPASDKAMDDVCPQAIDTIFLLPDDEKTKFNFSPAPWLGSAQSPINIFAIL